jgi:hypothetical protein
MSGLTIMQMQMQMIQFGKDLNPVQNQYFQGIHREKNNIPQEFGQI